MSRWSKWVPLTGVAFAALIIASFAVSGETPGVGASPQHVVSWFTDHKDSQLASALLGMYAVVFFLFFAAFLRSYIVRVRPEAGALAALSLGGAVLLAVGGAAFAAITFALADKPDKLGGDAAQALNVLNNDFFAPLVIGACVFMIANGIATVRWGILPAWLGWIAILIGVVCVTPIGFFGVLASVAWVIVVSVLLFLRAPAETAPPAPAPTATTTTPA
jgi:hypothetical protein